MQIQPRNSLWKKGNAKPNTKRAEGKRRGFKFQPRIESLEMRALLSITAVTPEAVTATEGTAFTGPVATFTSPDNGPFTATIDWGDGTTTTVSGSSISGGPSPAAFTVNGTNTYADEATDTFKVTVTDTSDSMTASATGTATVDDADIFASQSASVSATEGTTFSGPVATFINNLGYPGNTASDFTATIDWGDGTTDTGTVTGSPGTFTVSGSHLYADELTGGTITVVLNDDAPNSATETVTGTATAVEADVLATGTPVTTTATEGSTFSGTVATFTNTGYATNPASDFAATIDWGDGSSSTGTVSLASGTLSVAGSHVYTATGTETATISLTDDAPGTATATTTATIAVATSTGAATITPVGPVTIGATEGTTFSSAAVATFTDTDVSAVAGDFTATIDWGDGTADAGTVTGSAGTFTVGGSHLYTDELAAGTASVVLTQTTPATATGTASGSADAAEADALATVSPVSISATEGTTFSSTALATFTTSYTANVASDFSATIDWGDGTADAGTVTGSAGTFTVGGSHLYADELAAAPVSVVLTDDSPGIATATATGTADVAEGDTFATVGPVSISATEGVTFSGTLATFTNASYPTNAAPATIDWGDGTITPGTISLLAPGTLVVSGSHLYSDELAAAPVSVVLVDNSPGTATATATGTANVAEADVLATGTPVTTTATEGSTFSGTVATFTNTGYPTNPASDFAATIDWGDGSANSAGTVSLAGGTLSVSGSHVYTAAGTETATISLTDDAPGTATAATTATIAVATSTGAATITPVGPVTISATEGTSFSSTAVASFTDTDVSAVAGDFTATIDWGDGTADAGTVTGSAGAFTVGGSHLYTDEMAAGTATVVLTQTTPTTATGTATGTADAAEADVLASGTPVSTTATEGSIFSGTVAAFSNTGYPTNPASDFAATIDWGDGSANSAGTVSLAGGTLSVSGSHVYTAAGTETATISLTDDAPGTATATTTATIAVATSTASATITPVGAVTITATEGTAFSNSAVASFTDTDTSAVAGDFTATIDWGDGTTSTGSVTGSAGTFSVGGIHLYSDELAAGTASVVLTQTTPTTATGTATGSAEAAEADVLITGTPVTATATEGSNFTGTVATFTNGYPTNPASDFTATIDWGDGSSSAGTVSLAGGTLSVAGSHVYTATGTETATIVLADNVPGTASATATATIAVASSTATITPVGTVTISATEGTTFSSTGVATFTDTDVTAVASDFTATINWGDGTSSTGSVTGSAGTFTVGGSHLYADELAAGTASVVLTQTTPTTATGTATGTANAAEADVLAHGTPVTATATAGSTFSGTVATFTNTGYPTNPASDFTATINWGDGSSSTGTVTLASGTLSVAGSHVYSTSGTETASIVLADNAPGTASATATATITVASSTSTITPLGTVTISATEGTTFSSTAVAVFTDTNTSVVASNFTATINWGDGTSSTGSVTGATGTFTVGGSHLYADELAAGTASVVLTQTTPSTATGTATGTASAAEADVLAHGTPVTATATAGSTFSGSVATFTNTGYPTNPASDFTATINWGDGTSSTGTVSLASGTLSVAGSHVYSTTGTETATIVLADNAPGTATATATATVNVVSAPAAPILTITKSGTPATLPVGANETYIVTFSNSGSAAATNTTFTDVLPAGETLVSATDSHGGTVTNSNGTLTETIASFAAGATDTITIIVTVGSSLAGTSVTNTARVSATNFNGGVAMTSPFTITVTAAHVTTGVGLLAGEPGNGTEQAFVQNLYRELLGREPDANGETFWLAYLSQHDNAAGRQQVIQAFLNSPEYAIHYITTAYNVILGRAPDLAGLQFWTGKMGQPGTAGQHSGSADEKYIIAAFYGSDEFYLKSGNTPQGWVNALYEDILGRPADGDGLAFWEHELSVRGAGDRDGIVRDLLTTPEAAHFLLDSFYPVAGGTASTPLSAPGSTAGTGLTELALLTGEGWENLYLQGPYDSQPEGNDTFFTSLAGGAGWDDTQLLLLSSSQYYSNANRPVTS